MHLGLTFFAIGEDKSKAIEYMEKAIKLSPLLPDLYNNYGELLLQMDNVDQAMNAFHESLSTDELYPFPYINVANYMMAIEGSKDAEIISLINKAIEVDGDCDACKNVFFLMQII